MPFGKQFSPKQVEFPELLDLAARNQGDCPSLEEAILARYFGHRPTSQPTLAMNTRLSMQQYGLLEKDCTFTDIGTELHSQRTGPEDLYRRFAHHILLRCYGNQLLQAIRILRDRGLPITAPSLAEQLDRMGVEPGGRSGEKLNPMRLWLEKAGVFTRDWELDERRVEEVLGLDSQSMDSLSALTSEQRAFLQALARVPSSEAPHSSNEIARVAEHQSSVRYDRKQLPKKVLFPLKEAGFLTVTKTTSGRGAKPYLVSGTEKLVREVVAPALAALETVAGPIDPTSLRRPLRDLLADVRDTSLGTDPRGKALEGVALQLLFGLKLEFTGWRKRANETGGAEVDLTAVQSNGRYAVWQIQCKVSALPGREPVDREVGVAQSVRSNVLAFVSAGTIGRAPRSAAENYMRTLGLNIIFIDGADLDALAKGGSPSMSVDREFEWVRRVRAGEP